MFAEAKAEAEVVAEPSREVKTGAATHSASAVRPTDTRANALIGKA